MFIGLLALQMGHLIHELWRTPCIESSVKCPEWSVRCPKNYAQIFVFDPDRENLNKLVKKEKRLFL